MTGGPKQPGAPTLTAPTAGLIYLIGESVVVSATSPNTDLTRMDWVLDPGPSEVIIATDASSPYSQTWVVAQALGAHTLVARAVRGALSTNSAAISLTIANPTLVINSTTSAGTETPPANFLSPALLARSKARVQCWAGGGGGTTAVGGGGGGAYSEEPELTLTPLTGYALSGSTGAGLDTDAADVTFGSTLVVAKGGKSGTNGGTGGAASGGTGAVKFDGGNATLGAGDTVGGGGAGSAAAGSGQTGGSVDGGYGGTGSTSLLGGTEGGGGYSKAASAGTGRQGKQAASYYTNATAGFPRLMGYSQTRATANGTSLGVTMPSGIIAGELLRMLVTSDGNPTITESVGGWTKVGQVSDATNAVTVALFYKVAAGSDTATIATSASEKICVEVRRYAGAGTPEWSTATGSSTSADPPSHTYSGGSAKVCWEAGFGCDEGAPGNRPLTLTNYGDFTRIQGAGTDSSSLITGRRCLETATENPGAFTIGSEQWVAWTIAIPPA